jgi:hypothetical protein
MDSARTMREQVRVAARELVIVTTHIHEMTVSPTATAAHSDICRYLYFTPPLSYGE